MSLFGTSPDSPKPSSNLKSSLFDDVSTSSPGQKSSSGLFADQSGPSGDDNSTWDFQPTPRRSARGDLIKNLLAADQVPESYIDAFDAMIDGPDRVNTSSGVGVAWPGLRRLVSASGLADEESSRILAIVSPHGQKEGTGLGRAEFNVLLALVGLAQEGEEVSLDGVDERRRRLPQPKLPNLHPPVPRTPTKAPKPAEDSATRPQAPTTNIQTPPPPARPQNIKPTSIRKQSISFPDQDPWGSPGTTKITTSSDSAPASSAAAMNGMQSSMPPRTTSTFTTAPPDDLEGSDQSTMVSSGVDGWGSSYGTASLESSGFDGALGDSLVGGGSAAGQLPIRQPGHLGGRSANSGAEETVTVTALTEKEGVFLFQYRNYEVASSRRNSKVVRRYSDFVWLLDCLHKKYPFRQLPLLPPKRVAINGRHIAADNLFIEKRRRGLARFSNALVRHPVLSQEQLVVMFLTVPTELSVWRKQAAIQVQEEFVGRPLPPDLEDSLPRDLEDLFATTRSGVRRATEIYIALCALFERLIKRREGICGEYLRFSTLLATATEASKDTYAVDTNDVPLLNEGLHATSKGLNSSATLLGDESTTWDEGVLEDLKRQRDALVSMRDLFDRRERYDRDTIPALEKRIKATEGKLETVRAKPEGARKVGEAEKLEESIMKDKENIIAQHARSVFVKECIRDEINIFQSSLFHVSRSCQDWAAERVKYAELQADCWRALVEGIETMPVGE